MGSLQRLALKQIARDQASASSSATQGRRGVLGLDTVKETMVGLLVLAVVAIAVFLALVSLQGSSLFPAASQGANATAAVINNVTNGTTLFFGNVPTIMVVLGAVVIILVVTLIILAVNRFGGRSDTGSL